LPFRGGYTRIRNWSKFQHYTKRNPPWIKLYRVLLDDPAWHALSGESAKGLIMLWMIAAEDNGELPASKTLAFRLRISENRVTALLSDVKEWIEDDASNMLASCKQDAIPETETETETYTETEPLVPAENCFQTFWKAYPVKINEAAAFRAWCKVPGIHNHLEEILTAIMHYEMSGLWDDQTKIPHAARFIQDRRWKDEIPKGGKREHQIERSIRESVELAKEYGIAENDLEMGHAPRPALQPQRTLPAGRKSNLH
jgi:hypothetical protein